MMTNNCMRISSEKEFNRYSIAARDFERAIDFLAESEKHPENSLAYEALLISGAICYSRPFSQNEKGGNPNASVRIEFDSFSSLSQQDRDIHDRCIDLRNKALAHAEWDRYPTKVNRQTKMVWSKMYSVLSEPMNWNALLDLTNKLLIQCHELRVNYLNTLEKLS